MMTAGALVFGPVPSRRLGRSLGVDLLPRKTCTFDCLYCQVGPTQQTSVEHGEFVSAEAVTEAVRKRLSSRPDFITISGSGEPTLYDKLGELIQALKALKAAPVAVITNGSLLWRPEVRAALREADLVAPSLDAGDEETFRRINRPHVECTFSRLLEGLRDFRAEFQGRYWLEVFFLAGINDDAVSAGKIAVLAQSVGADRIQLNAVARPTAHPNALAVPESRLRELLPLFGNNAEIIADFASKADAPAAGTAEVTPNSILELLRRRPCTVAGLAQGLAAETSEIRVLLESLLQSGVVRAEERDGKTFFTAYD